MIKSKKESKNGGYKFLHWSLFKSISTGKKAPAMHKSGFKAR